MVTSMADGIEEIWESEDIPNTDRLFMRVHSQNIDENGKLKPGAFRNLPKDLPGSGMSTDWEKYSTPEETQKRARKPSENAVIQLVCEEVRQVPGQTVTHTPKPEFNNQAHTDVYGEKNTEVRLKLMAIYQIVIPLSPRI
ncbi:MAG: hypothetical protein KME17_05685 [Cyanosarcina radialis HA8281-LM2]|nr:hypothetical protein [Cyanosarcina radialis HA8281-LM2]